MCVFHGGLEISEAAPGGLIDQGLAVPRPSGAILRVLGRRQTPNGARSDVESKDIVVAELVFVRLAVRNEGDLFAIGRPVDRMLVVIAGRELPDGAGRHIDSKDMQPAIVIEAGESLIGIWFVE